MNIIITNMKNILRLGRVKLNINIQGVQPGRYLRGLHR